MSNTAGAGFDAELALNRAGDDLELARELAAIFIDQTSLWVADLRLALTLGNHPEVLRLAHTIKSSADNVGCVEVRTVAQSLESRASAANAAESRLLLEELVESINSVLPRLAAFSGAG